MGHKPRPNRIDACMPIAAHFPSREQPGDALNPPAFEHLLQYDQGGDYPACTSLVRMPLL